MSFEESYQAHAITQCTPATPELWLRPVAGPLEWLRGEYVPSRTAATTSCRHTRTRSPSRLSPMG